MPIPQETLDALNAKTHKNSVLNLNQKNINDIDIITLVTLLNENPHITTLLLENNTLTNASTKELAKLLYVKKLRIKQGNQIDLSGFQELLNNHSIIDFPIVGGGERVVKLRIHFKNNAQKPVPKPKAALPKRNAAKPLAKKAIVYKNVTQQKISNGEDKPAQEEVSFLATPVSQNAESGQDDFLKLAEMLFLDLEQNPSDNGALMRYLVLVYHHFQHNSTYAPQPGYGKNQDREREGKLEYFRSQNKSHPHKEFVSSLLRDSSSSNKGKCYLPVNEPLKKLLVLSSVSKTAQHQLESINSLGYIKAGKSAKGVGLTLAYSGLRSNNFTAYHTAIKAYVEADTSIKKTEALQNLLKRHIGATPKKLQNMPEAEIKTRTKNRLDWFLHETPPPKALSKLHSEMFDERRQKLIAIDTRIKDKTLKQINIETIDQNTCFIFKLYPSCPKKLQESKNYAEGVTNVLIGFFISLLNYNAKKQGLSIRTERRQSFGFLRPTVTDVGGLRIRLSLGLEPPEFIEVIEKSLEQFDAILEKYDFVKQQNVFVKKCFEVSEKSQAKNKKPTTNTGRKILTSVRSDEDKWKSVLLAEDCLEPSLNKIEPNISEAFENYLNRFVIKRINTDAEGNFTKNALNVNPKENHFNKTQLLAKSDKPIVDKSVVFKLVNNICNYTHTFMSKLALESDINLPDELKNSYAHSIELIFKYYIRAKELLEKFSQFEISHLYAHANNLIENLLEDLIILQGLCDIQRIKNPQNTDIIKQFTDTYRAYTQSCFDINQNNVSVTYTDSGQQAIIASILAMDMQVASGTDQNRKYLSDKSVYIHQESYYEINHFFDNVLGIKSSNKSTAKIVFVDITEINRFNIADFPQTESVIIDVTNNNTLNQPRLRELTKQLHTAGKWIMLAESLLKHGQLGLDKYQSGRITCIAPEGKALTKNISDELKSISNVAMEPEVARYLHMVTEITGEYTTPSSLRTMEKPIEAASLAALPHAGLFKSKKQQTTVKPVPQPPSAIPQIEKSSELKF